MLGVECAGRVRQRKVGGSVWVWFCQGLWCTEVSVRARGCCREWSHRAGGSYMCETRPSVWFRCGLRGAAPCRT